MIFQPVANGTQCMNGTVTAKGDATCEPDGALVCNGPAEFGICNFGRVVWQAVAPGTVCVDGVIGFA